MYHRSGREAQADRRGTVRRPAISWSCSYFTTGVARTPERAASFASRYGPVLVNDYARALADPSIDAVVLATPHTQHVEQVIAAARAGKHVFTDKPFALTRAGAEAAAQACADARRVLAVGFNWRYQPALQEIRRMLQDGRLGRLLHIEGNFNGPSVYRFPKEHWRIWGRSSRRRRAGACRCSARRAGPRWARSRICTRDR